MTKKTENSNSITEIEQKNSIILETQNSNTTKNNNQHNNIDTYNKINNFFKEYDLKKKNSEKGLVFDTEKGIFGVSDISIVYEFLKKIEANSNDVFCDLGSGDGRVVITASLFCNAKGIEFDNTLYNESKTLAKKLDVHAEFICQDYETFDFSKISILFSFADHFFTPKFIEKLKHEFKGTLYIYQGVFLPENIPKGRTIWVKQTPIISYEFQ